MHSRSVIPWLLLVVLALIVYGSLYPFNFKPDAMQGGVLEALRQLSWVRAGRGDRISNVLLYLPLGFCLFLWLETRWHRRAVDGRRNLAAARAVAVDRESRKVYISARVSSLTDVTLTAAGTLLGVTARSRLGRRLTRLMHFAWTERQRAAARSGRGAAAGTLARMALLRRSCRSSNW
jgi:VanZ family protein